MFAPRVTPRSKVVTSGRLTGAVGAPAHRTRGTLKSRPEVAYSLYSTDSEDQVATLHKGLDRCAALLSDILQSDNAGAVPKKDKAVKDGAAKCRPHTLTGKKAIRRSVTKSSTKTPGIIPQRSTVTPQRSTATPQRSIATPHSGVKLHPPARKHHLLKNLSKSCSPLATLNCVPVRDQGLIGVSSDEGPETEGKMKRVQCLLEELRTLMAGQGDTAQTYLCLLEQTVSSALNTDVNKNPAQSTTKNQTDRTELQMLQSHNTQLQRQVKVLNQQLQDQEASQQLLNSQVLSLQGQLRTSEKELTQVQKILQETQRRLQNKEEETVCLKTELESTRGRLRVTLQDKFKLEGTVQQKQQEIEELQRVIDQYDSSTPTLENQVYPPGAAKEHITQYLLSLEQNRPTHPDESLDLPLCSSLRAPGPDQVPERDVDSVISDWSIQSDSTFNTRDESAFRDGLAALDASIASLQKTLKMDLVKT